MRCVRRSNALRSQVTANVQVSRIFSLLDGLMLCARFSQRFLLDADVIVQFSVARFKFTPDPLDFFFHHRKFRLYSDYLLLGQTCCIRTARARADKFGALFREASATRTDAC